MANAEIRSFIQQIQSWFSQAKATNSDKELSYPPSEVILSLEGAIEEQPIPSTYQTKIREVATAKIGEWRSNLSAANSLVIIGSPVEPIARIVEESLLNEKFEEVRVIALLSEAKRPTQPSEIAPQLQNAIREVLEEENESGHPKSDRSSDARQDRQIAIVIPCLAQYFLRCIQGWEGIDFLQNKVVQNPSYFWILGCNSWAWAFLDCVGQISAYLEQVHLLPALDRDNIQSWLAPVADNVLSELSENEDSDIPKDRESSVYWDGLESLSSGMSSVAAQLWLQSLRTSSADSIQDILAQDNLTPVASEQWRTEIAAHLQQSQPILPSLPDLTTMDRYLLHSLLIHGKMTRSHLALSLGEIEQHVRPRTQILLRSGVIRQQGECLAIHPAHYPRLKLELNNNNFLVGDD